MISSLSVTFDRLVFFIDDDHSHEQLLQYKKRDNLFMPNFHGVMNNPVEYHRPVDVTHELNDDLTQIAS